MESRYRLRTRHACILLVFCSHLSLNSANDWNHRSPNHPNVLAVKRIIAIEGDRVFSRAPYPAPIADIPAGHVWVEGDNRDGNKSLDSNHYGPIPTNLIQGKVTHVLRPWASSGPIKWAEFRGRTKVIRRRKEDALQWT
jgi:inner membrane protease subunit 2